MDYVSSKSNLEASVLAPHSKGIDLMIVWSVFIKRVSDAQTPDVCLQARQC